MSGPFEIECPFGGIGNFHEGEQSCSLCPHTEACYDETQEADLYEMKRLRFSAARHKTPWSTKPAASPIRRDVSPMPVARPRSDGANRPMPIEGESPVLRFFLNALMEAIAAFFQEASGFCSRYDFAPRLPAGRRGEDDHEDR